MAESNVPATSVIDTADMSHVIENDADGSLLCWCGEGSWRRCFRSSRFGLLRCSACATYCINPVQLRRESDSVEFYNDYYSESRDIRPLPRPSQSSKFWEITTRFPELAQLGERAVDIGSGDGSLCAELKDAGWPSVTGLEISRVRVERSRQLYPDIQFHHCLLHQSPLLKSSLDLAVMDSVVEHLPNPLAMLEQVRSYMTEGGHIVLLTPNMDSGHFRFLGRRWTGMLAPHVHIFLFDAASLSRLVTQAGFQVLGSGSLHIKPYRLRQWCHWIADGKLKDVAWRAHQEIGSLYGHLIGSGPMLYVVAKAG